MTNIGAYQSSVDIGADQTGASGGGTTISPDTASFGITAKSVGFIQQQIFAPDTASFSFAGQAVTLWESVAELDPVKYVAQRRLKYIFTLTGADDGLEDVEIPIASFQARLREIDDSTVDDVVNGSVTPWHPWVHLSTIHAISTSSTASDQVVSLASTYLTVVVPGKGFYSDITDRPNGALRVDAVHTIGGVEVLRKTLVEVVFEELTIEEGPMSTSITLAGYSNAAFTTNEITLVDATNRKVSDGLLSCTFAEPNFDLNLGDEITVGEDVFVAGEISYYVRARAGEILTRMEVTEYVPPVDDTEETGGGSIS